MRWAERYARQRNTHKAIAHFGRALEFGTTGPGYSVVIKVYADKAEVEANKSSYNETGQAAKPFLDRATDDISDATSTEFIAVLQKKLESELLTSVRSRERPTVRIDIYESSEVGTALVEGLRGAERGVYIEMRPSGKEFDHSEEEEIKKAIRLIVPKEMAGVSESDIRSIDALREPKIKLNIILEKREFAEGADSFIWKRSVPGLLSRYIEEQCGICALVSVTKTRKRARDGSSASTLHVPIRIEGLQVVENESEMTDEQAEELEGRFALCLPGIRRILGRIYEVGSEQDDKIAVSWWLG